MPEFILGTTRPHEAAQDHGISLAGFGIPPESMATWMHLQQFFDRGDVTPCRDRSEWTSTRKADKETAIRGCQSCPAIHGCREYAETAGETTGIYGSS